MKNSNVNVNDRRMVDNSIERVESRPQTRSPTQPEFKAEDVLNNFVGRVACGEWLVASAFSHFT